MKRIKKVILILISAPVALVVAAFFYSPDTFWARIAGNPDLGAVDFADLVKNRKPNQYLICPPGVCKLATPDAPSEIYPLDPVTLKLRFIAAVGAENIEIVENSDNRLRFIIKTPFWRFPDTVSVAFFPNEKGSTLAIYSRSQIGYSDFGTNRKRVEKWLSALDG